MQQTNQTPSNETVANPLGADAPVVTSDRIDSMYNQLSTMRVALDADPLEFGPKRLNAKIAECRGALSQCEQLFLAVSQDLHWYKRRHRLETATHALKVQELLTNDPEVRAGRNVTDREAVANIKLRSSKELVDKLHFAVEDLEAVLGVVRTKRDDLKDTQGRLRDQLKVCQEEISLGARWGTRQRPRQEPVSSAPTPEPVDKAGESLDAMMDDVLNRQGADVTEEPQEEEEPIEAFNRVSVTSSEVDMLKGVVGDVTLDDALSEIPDVGPQPKIGIPSESEDLDSFLATLG